MKTKYSLLVVIAGFLICMHACKKDDGPTSIFAKWNVVSDSTYTGVGITNHAVNYAGQPGDYFDFRTNGTLYTREGAVLDTLNFSFVSNTQIIIVGFGLIANGIPATSHITNFTAHSITIASPIALTPGGVFGRKVTLSR
jgi:hypothetical protein